MTFAAKAVLMQRPNEARNGRPFFILPIVLLVSAALAVTTLAYSARRASLSLRAQLLRVLLPLAFPRGLRLPAGSAARPSTPRRGGPSLPSWLFRRQFHVQHQQSDGHALVMAAPRVAPTTRLRILYLHGGAYVNDVVWPHWDIAAGLIERTGGALVLPIYPLAPEHDWQAAHAMVCKVYTQLVDEVGAAHVVVAGDSAGGGFALALAQQLRDRGAPLPAALLLFSPWLDVTMSDPAQVALERRDVMLSIDTLRLAGAWWAGELAVTDPRISPLYGTMDRLPPMAVFTGTDDLLNPDAHRLAAKAAAADVPLTLYEYANEFHVWMGGLPRFIPEAGRALDQAAAFIRAWVDSPAAVD